MNKNPDTSNLKPFNEGVSGNPNGRPKGKLSRTTLVKRWLEATEKTKNPITKELEQLSQADIIILALIKKARSGDVQAARELLDSCFGKVKENIDHTTNGEPITKVVFSFKDPEQEQENDNP